MKGEAVSELLGGAEVMRDLVKSVDSGLEDLVDYVVQEVMEQKLLIFLQQQCLLRLQQEPKWLNMEEGRFPHLQAVQIYWSAWCNIDLSPDQVIRSMQSTGVGFMFAPNHHPAMKNVAPVRRELGTRTIFNVLGPLTNPARSRRQLIGVYDKKLLLPIANVLKQLGSTHVLVVHGESGLDEMCFSSRTYYAELKKGKITEGISSLIELGFDE